MQISYNEFQTNRSRIWKAGIKSTLRLKIRLTYTKHIFREFKTAQRHYVGIFFIKFCPDPLRNVDITSKN
jgi:hypothetical protein